MRFAAIAAMIAGLAAIAAMILYFGAEAVVGALAAIGWTGFAAIAVIHLALQVVMGVAWRALVAGAPTPRFIWARMVRDAGSEVLPLSAVGGYVLGARALALTGISGTMAAASTIVDITLEFVGQLAYTALGLAWLVYLRPGATLAVPIAIGLVVASTAAAAFLLVQRRGIAYLDRIASILGKGWAERTASGAAALHGTLDGIYRNRRGLWLSFLLHLACWVASALEAWLALRLAGVEIEFGAVLAIESLLYAIRTAAFVVPNAVGVQEGAYILLGATFGLTPEMALALSLLKRARDLTIGLPALAVWQSIEGGRLWRRADRRLERPPAPVPVRVQD